MRTTLRILLCLVAATLLWMPLLHFPFKPSVDDFVSSQGIPDFNRAVLLRHSRLWSESAHDDPDIERMRESNPEWDFMGRTYLVLALANAALREPDAANEHLATMDRIIDDTLALERERSHYYFLMSYARSGRPWVHAPDQSVFVNGEIALMQGARRAVADHSGYREDMHRRLDHMIERMKKSPVGCAESYPDECWMFCNSVAIAAIQMGVSLDQRADRPFIEQWLTRVKDSLVHRETGLLISSFGVDGRPQQGPEGSSIWMATHCLRLVDPEFAADQYRRAKKQLAASFLGFGYAREWPGAAMGQVDIDSGPVIPVLGISPASSGLALLAAASFGDHAYMQSLLSSLHFAGFPTTNDQALSFQASNQVGDAVVAAALLCGPLWEKLGGRP